MAHAGHASAKTVLLLRHAKSSWDEPTVDDHDRTLSPRGVRAAGLMARHLATERVSVDLVLCSTAVRARQTFDRIVGSVGDPEVIFDTGLYTADAPALRTRLEALDDSVRTVLIVGHNPAMHDLARLLVGSGDRGALDQLGQKFPTGALARVRLTGGRWAPLKEGCGYLEAFTLPRELEVS